MAPMHEKQKEKDMKAEKPLQSLCLYPFYEGDETSASDFKSVSVRGADIIMIY